MASMRCSPPEHARKPDLAYRDIAMLVCYLAGMRTRQVAAAFGVSKSVASEQIARMRLRTGLTRHRDKVTRDILTS